MLHHECLCPPFQGAVGAGHDFIARQYRRLGRRVDLISGALERPSRRGRVGCASASTGRWVRTGGERSGVFQFSGMTLGSRRVHRAR